jgi:replicative DNA helicase
MNAQFIPGRAPAGVEMLRVPPHRIDAEQAVLGALMLDPSSLTKVSDWLSAEDFYRKDHQLIYRAICGLVERGTAVDSLTISDWFDANGLSEMLQGGSTYLIELDNNTASAATIVSHAEIVVEASRRRALIDAGTQLTEGAYKPGSDSQHLIAETMHGLSQMQASKLRGGLESVKGAMKRMHAELMARYQRGPGLLGMPWPWKDLNDCTKGLRDGVLYIVGARPSMGKSVFGLQVALFTALRGENAAFFSVEMGAEECMARAVACVGELPHEWVENPAKDDPDAEWYWSKLERSTAQILEAPLLIDETPGLTVEQFMARARRAHLQKPLRLIVLDHMHDMTLDPKRETRHELGRIAQAGKTLAKELRCPVILLAQLSRASATRSDKRPTMTDLRESGEIEQKADVILFLHREDYYDHDTHLKGVVEVIPAKGRNIRIDGPISLQNTFSEMRLQDWIGPLPVAPEPAQKAKQTRGMK